MPRKFQKIAIRDGIPKRAKRVLGSALLDFLITWVAFAAVFLTRSALAELDVQLGILATLVVCVSNVLALYITGVYDRIWGRTSGHGVMLIAYAVAASTALLFVLNVLANPRPLPLSVLLLGNLVALVGYVAVRYRSRLVSGIHWRWRAIWHQEFPKTATRTLIIGAGVSGQMLVIRMKHHFPDANYSIVGFIDDDPNKKGMYVEGCRVLGNRHDLKSLCEIHNVELIVFAIHNIEGNDFREMLELCEQTKARIKLVPDVFQAVNGHSGATLLRDVQADDLLGRSVIARHAGVDLSPVEHKVVLVTGAAGSIGSELSRQIVDYEPVKVILLDNNESGLHDLTIDLQERYPSLDIRPVLADISHCHSLKEVFSEQRPQVVFHAAAYKHVPMLEHSPQEALRVNIHGTANLMRLAREFEVERFVFISTDKAVNPSSVMGASKRIGELMLHACAQETPATRFTAVRFGNVLGSRGSVVPTFARQIHRGGPVTITDKDMTRYFMTIPEAANLIIHAACITKGDDIYLLQMGEVVKIADLAERMIRMRGLRPNVDIKIEVTGIRPGEKLHEQLYTEYETPVATVHPGIVQVQNGRCAVDPELFWSQTERLLKVKGDGPYILREILSVIDQCCDATPPQPHSARTATESAAKA